MPRCTVTFAASALADLRGVRTWYAEEGVPEVGDRLVREVLERLEALKAHPLLGREVPEFRQPFLRELIVPPFRVAYRYDNDRVQVVRVWRSERLLRLSGEE